MIIRIDEAAVGANMNKAVFDLQTCLDRRDAPQLHCRTMQPLAALSHAGPRAESFFVSCQRKSLPALRQAATWAPQRSIHC